MVKSLKKSEGAEKSASAEKSEGAEKSASAEKASAKKMSAKVGAKKESPKKEGPKKDLTGSSTAASRRRRRCSACAQRPSAPRGPLPYSTRDRPSAALCGPAGGLWLYDRRLHRRVSEKGSAPRG